MPFGIFIDSLILTAALVVLALSSNFVVENVLRIAEFLKIGEMATGFILLSISTSLPELAIAVISAPAGEGAISVGNVFGSNIADVLLVIGLMAIITGFSIKREDAKEFIRLLFMTSVISVALLLLGTLGLIQGILLFFIFAGYSYYLFRHEISLEIKQRVSRRKFHVSLIFFAVGMIALIASSDIAVQFSVRIASEINVSETYIGATIVALGTSLPELAIDITAVRRGNLKLALGDAVGSSMTNLTLILGFTGILSPAPFQMISYSGLVLFLLLANMLLWYFFDTERRLGKAEGAVFVALYAAFLLTEFGLQA